MDAGAGGAEQFTLRTLRVATTASQPASPFPAAGGATDGGSSCRADASAGSCEVGSPFAAWSHRGFDSRPPAGLVATSAAGWPTSHPLSLLRLLSSSSSSSSTARSNSFSPGGGFGDQKLGSDGTRASPSSLLALQAAPTTPAARTKPRSSAAAGRSSSPWLLPAAAAVWLLVLAVQLLAAAALR